MNAANKRGPSYGVGHRAVHGLIAFLLAACSGQSARTTTPPPSPATVSEAPSAPEPLQASGWYELSLRGQKIGYAQQLVVITPEGAILRHSETVAMTRSGEPLQLKTTYHATWDGARWQGKVTVIVNGAPTERPTHARRGDVMADESCIPAIFAASWLAMGQPVPACGVDPLHDHLVLPLTATTAPATEPTMEATTLARLSWRHPWGDIMTAVEGEPMQLPARMLSSDSAVATRVSQTKAEQSWTPPDLLALTAIGATPIAGGYRVAARDVPTLKAPPESMIFPGQQATSVKRDSDPRRDGDWLQYATSTHPLPASAIAHHTDALPMSMRDLKTLVAEVGMMLAPSLATGASFGDCRAVSALAATHLAQRQAAYRFATGWRYDAMTHTLVRHRWLLVLTKNGWISIDPTFGEVPGKPVLIGLIHEDPAQGPPVADLIFAMQAPASTQPSRGE